MNTHILESGEPGYLSHSEVNNPSEPEWDIVEVCTDQFHDHIRDCLDRYESGLNEEDTDYLQFSLDRVYRIYHWEAENFVDSPRSEFLLESIQEMASSLDLVLP